MISKPHLVESKGNAKIQCHFNLRILLEPSIEKKKQNKPTKLKKCIQNSKLGFLFFSDFVLDS